MARSRFKKTANSSITAIFGVKKTPKQMHRDWIDRKNIARREPMSIENWCALQNWKDANPKPIKKKTVFHIHSKPARRTRQRGESSRSNAKSGDSNDPDPEPELRSQQPLLQLFDQAALADLLCISKKSLQNTYSKAPHTLPSAISIPGAHGPRWTTQSVQSWLNSRPAHANTEHAPAATTKRKVGRPRIASAAGKGGASC